MNLRNLRLPIALLAALAVIGCGSKPADPTAPVVEKAPVEKSAPAGGKEVTAAGVSLTFPEDWKVVNLSQGDFEAAMKSLGSDPRGAEMAEAAKAAARSGMIKLFVFDPKGSKPGFMNNANLVVQSGIGNATLDQAVDASKQQLEGMGATVKTSKVTFPAGEFGRIESTTTAPNGKPYVAIGYAQVEGGNLSVVTFSCLPDQVSEFDTKAQSIMQTFKRG